MVETRTKPPSGAVISCLFQLLLSNCLNDIMTQENTKMENGQKNKIEFGSPHCFFLSRELVDVETFKKFFFLPNKSVVTFSMTFSWSF